MPFEIISAKLTGNPDAAGWAQIYEFSPDDEEKYKLRGKLFAVISTSTKEVGMDTVLAGREVLSRLHEEYFGETSGSSFSRLKISVEKVINEFSSWEDIQIACVSYVNNVFNVAAGGGARIVVLRQGDLSTILQSQSGEVQIASGIPKEGDFVILATSQFFNRFSQGVLKGAIQGRDPKEVVEVLAPIIHSGGLTGSLGASFLKVVTLAPKFDQAPAGNRIEPTEMFSQGVKNISGLFKGLKARAVYVRNVGDEKVPPKKRVLASIGAVLLITLVVSIFFGIRQKRNNDLQKEFEENFSVAVHELDEAETLYSLNPDRARDLFYGAREKVLGLSKENFKEEEVAELKKKIEEGGRKILGEHTQEPLTFVDLGLLSQGFDGDSLVFSDGKVFVFDKEGKRIVSVEIKSKRAEVIAGTNLLGKAEAIAVYSDRVFTITPEGIFEIFENSKKVIEAEWDGEILAYSYAGNFYVLEKSGSVIWRYAGSENGFSARRNWLTESVVVDLTDAKQIVINGSIWVLKDDGEVVKLTLGNLQAFGLKNVAPDVDKADAIFVSEETEDFYVLESDGGRVVVVNKDGEYKAQYLSDQIKNARSLVVSEEEKKLILLTGNKLFSIDLEHL
ncbi:MAG: hypothetical protein UT24_C0005G0015 [Candidatus Woesebacteria bacterium GW2011_GWB1_39_12]|uniref:PPM-type phosphatase domain-containing protein n=2 Tax=Candidatus Woeseibacteriota TaxID=1752722 RepID=A0A0G0M3V7_9BACT|nr:MAG: hypothetical protein UT23_C0006G0038 [Candidatus Woesebacteria bacterium GW2011_GWA1_39_12]KKR01306.1 MAG: hypothetical protein UT24_C0005G0015 [Candidatus Woesebacteria bacterium GW2011_GWB1_39_12]